jgi:truncated hemoglobin YjbI
VSYIAEIDIATVLKKLDVTYDEATNEEKVYGIAFIDRNGNKHYPEVRKHVRIPRLMPTSQNPRGRSQFNQQREGIISLYDMQAGHPLTPKTCMIFQFRDFKSDRWLNVFH